MDRFSGGFIHNKIQICEFYGHSIWHESIGSASPFSVGAVFSYTIHFLDLAVNRD